MTARTQRQIASKGKYAPAIKAVMRYKPKNPDDVTLTPAAKLVYFATLERSGEGYTRPIPDSTITDDTGLSRQSVITARTDLERIGLFTCRVVGGRYGGRVYTFYDPDEVLNCTESGQLDRPTVQNLDRSLKTQKRRPSVETGTATPPAAASPDISGEFEKTASVTQAEPTTPPEKPKAKPKNAGNTLVPLYLDLFKAKTGEPYAGSRGAVGKILQRLAKLLGVEVVEQRIRRWFFASRRNYDPAWFAKWVQTPEATGKAESVPRRGGRILPPAGPDNEAEYLAVDGTAEGVA